MILKKISHSALKGMLLLALAAWAPQALAVSDAEMDQARAIAGKYYIRYINDGAGYLDNWTPSSMADLEKKLANNTDRENFKKFKSIATPTDYAGWDKEKLVAYWSDTFFKDNGSSLDKKAADNGLCKKQIKQTVQRMEIAAPAAATPAAEPEATPAAEAVTPEEEAIAQELAEDDAKIQEAQDLVNQEAQAQPQKESSGTWVYIMVLAILVGVVIFLVVFASRTMKGRPEAANREENPDDDDTALRAGAAPVPVPVKVAAAETAGSSIADDSRMREKYAEALAAKAEEIRGLNRQLSDMEKLTANLKTENRKLTAEVELLRHQLEEAQAVGAVHEAYKPSSASRNDNAAQSRPRHAEGETKEIYLGRVNSKGIFVRADRHAVDGQSVFKLTTTNGHSGTFTIIANPLIEEQLLDDPGKWLAGGCFAKDIFDTEDRSAIHVDIPGKAVFLDGAWRVERKAKIHYS